MTTSRSRRLATAMWMLGALAYVVAVFNRTSLGVAGTQAIERFSIGGTELAWFAVLQLLVYVVIQLPAGMLVDRFGPRRVLTCALLLMGAGQLLLAWATSYPAGIGARIVLGSGDALTFVSVLRLVVIWCPADRVALLVQLTSTLGMVGNLASAAPLLALLITMGWTSSFVIVAGATVAIGMVLFATIRDDSALTGSLDVRPAGSLPSMLRGVGESWRTPGVRLGFWMHFTATFPWVSFAMLWGLPFLTRGQGLGPELSSVLLTVMVLANMAVSPVFGQIAGRRPAARLALHSWVMSAVAVIWLVVLCWPAEHTPLWVLGLLAVALGLCGPSSMVGMDIARTSSPMDRVATASAVANIGGTIGALTAIQLIGTILDITSDLPASTAFDLAFASQFGLFALGGWRMWHWSRSLPRVTVLQVRNGAGGPAGERAGDSPGKPG